MALVWLMNSLEMPLANVCGHGDVRIPAREWKIWSGTDDNDIARKVLAYIPDDFSGNSFVCYILFQKERLYIQVRKVIFAFISRQKAEAFLKICSLTYRTFANFLAGQCLEAIILGSMFVLKSRYRILGSSTGFVDCTKVLKNLFAMVHQCFDVFFWCGDRCYTIIFHQKIQNIRRQKRRKRRTKTDIFNTKVQER